MFWQIFILIAIGLIVPSVLIIGAFAYSKERDSLVIGGIIWMLIVVIATPLLYTFFRYKVLSFDENLNTVVIAVKNVPTICTEDGLCVWTYRCHPYLVLESYQVYDSSTKAYVTRYRPRTKYHQCPYSTEEDTWLTITALKESDPASENVTIMEANHRLPEDPNAHRWDEMALIPPFTLQEAGVGEPQVSKDYEAVLRSGIYPAISLTHVYTNYLLSDPDTTMRPSVSQDELVPYQVKHLLPNLHILPDSSHYTNKVYFVGMVPPSNTQQWEKNLAHFNAEAGALRQMDLHLVVLPDTAIGDLHHYCLVLRGYWSDPHTFGKGALPKNALVVVITTNGQVILRAEAFTLMPSSADGVSNTTLFQRIQNKLPGQPFQPGRVLGNPQPIVHHNENVTYQAGSSLLEQLLLLGPDHFKRVPMENFRYLEDEILPSNGDCVWIVFLVCFIGLLLGGGISMLLKQREG